MENTKLKETRPGRNPQSLKSRLKRSLCLEGFWGFPEGGEGESREETVSIRLSDRQLSEYTPSGGKTRIQ